MGSRRNRGAEGKGFHNQYSKGKHGEDIRSLNPLGIDNDSRVRGGGMDGFGNVGGNN